MHKDQLAAQETIATAPHGGHTVKHENHKARERGEGDHHEQRHLQRCFPRQDEAHYIGKLCTHSASNSVPFICGISWSETTASTNRVRRICSASWAEIARRSHKVLYRAHVVNPRHSRLSSTRSTVCDMKFPSLCYLLTWLQTISSAPKPDLLLLTPPADRQSDSALARRQAGRPGPFGPHSRGLLLRSDCLHPRRPFRGTARWQRGRSSAV